MCVVLQKLSNEFPELERYENMWPLREYVKQHFHDYRGRNVTPAALKKGIHSIINIAVEAKEADSQSVNVNPKPAVLRRQHRKTPYEG
jgi:hypothetical protein